jgi:hypothetical protein
VGSIPRRAISFYIIKIENNFLHSSYFYASNMEFLLYPTNLFLAAPPVPIRLGLAAGVLPIENAFLQNQLAPKA